MMLNHPRMLDIPFRNTLKSTAVKPTTASSIGAGAIRPLAAPWLVLFTTALRHTFSMKRFSSCVIGRNLN